MKTRVINLFGGPGSGKSTAAAEIFSIMKKKGVNVELVNEWIKGAVWESRPNVYANQIYVFAKQLKKMKDLEGKVDFIITDSPLLLSIIYGRKAGNTSETFERLVWEEWSKFFNHSFIIERTKKYNPAGRLQTEEEAVVLDEEIKDFLWNGAGVYAHTKTMDEIADVAIWAAMLPLIDQYEQVNHNQVIKSI